MGGALTTLCFDTRGRRASDLTTRRKKVYAAKALKLEPAWDWEVLLEGTDAPLVVSSRDGDGRGGAYVVVAFDVMDSNWPLMRSFPMFLERSVQWLRGEGDARAAGQERAAARLYFQALQAEPN